MNDRVKECLDAIQQCLMEGKPTHDNRGSLVWLGDLREALVMGKTEPVHLLIRADIIDAPKDIQAIAAIDQIIGRLELTPQQEYAVLKFMSERAEVPF